MSDDDPVSLIFIEPNDQRRAKGETMNRRMQLIGARAKFDILTSASIAALRNSLKYPKGSEERKLLSDYAGKLLSDIMNDDELINLLYEDDMERMREEENQ